MGKIPEGFTPPSWQEMAVIGITDALSSLVAKVTAVASDVGLIQRASGTSLEGRVSTATFLGDAKKAWELCDLGNFPELESVEDILNACPEEKRAVFIQRLNHLPEGARAIYLRFQSSLEGAWQEVFPEAAFPQFEPTDNLQERILKMLRACQDRAPAEQDRLMKAFSRDSMVRVVYTEAMQTDEGKRLFCSRMDSWIRSCWQEVFDEALPCQFDADQPPMDRLKAAFEAVLQKPVESQSKFIKALGQDKIVKQVYEYS